jgi:hypothetical protein
MKDNFGFISSEFLDMLPIDVNFLPVDVKIELVFNCLCNLDRIYAAKDLSGFRCFCSDPYGDFL